MREADTQLLTATGGPHFPLRTRAFGVGFSLSAGCGLFPAEISLPSGHFGGLCC